ncbi:MAG: hypothetical protein WDN69_34690 [Aliidongia sp.]
MHRQIVLFDEGAGPDFGEDLVLGHEPVVMFNQGEQDADGAWAQLDRGVVTQQPSPCRQQLERSESVPLLHGLPSVHPAPSVPGAGRRLDA